MKYSNFSILTITNELKMLIEKKLPQKIGYAIVRNFKIFEENNNIYSESLQNLVKKYEEHIVKDKNGKIVISNIGVPEVEESVRENYIKDINDLLSIEIEIETFKIPKETFDYNDERCDILLPKETLFLMEICCEK